MFEIIEKLIRMCDDQDKAFAKVLSDELLMEEVLSDPDVASYLEEWKAEVNAARALLNYLRKPNIGIPTYLSESPIDDLSENGYEVESIREKA